jgi:hypothetical protein
VSGTASLGLQAFGFQGVSSTVDKVGIRRHLRLAREEVRFASAEYYAAREALVARLFDYAQQTTVSRTEATPHSRAAVRAAHKRALKLQSALHSKCLSTGTLIDWLGGASDSSETTEPGVVLGRWPVDRSRARFVALALCERLVQLQCATSNGVFPTVEQCTRLFRVFCVFGSRALRVVVSELLSVCICTCARSCILSESVCMPVWGTGCRCGVLSPSGSYT